MIRTGAQYRDSIRDGRAVYIGGELVKDVSRLNRDPAKVIVVDDCPAMLSQQPENLLQVGHPLLHMRAASAPRLCHCRARGNRAAEWTLL